MGGCRAGQEQPVAGDRRVSDHQKKQSATGNSISTEKMGILNVKNVVKHSLLRVTTTKTPLHLLVQEAMNVKNVEKYQAGRLTLLNTPLHTLM